VRISWEDARGLRNYGIGKCVDVSEDGLRIEVAEAIPLHSHVSLRAEGINFSGSATVKHVARRGSKFILGLELSHGLRDQVLALLRQPQPVVPS
jgi:hypothetical protein